jgi:AcrR family transcriptional regulator
MSPRKYDQRLRADAAEQTRRRVLDALYERLRGGPARPVSVDEVARSAGTARSTVYLIFGSRGGLFDALAADLQERGGFDRIVQAVAEPDAREHLRGGIRGGVQLYASHRDVMRVLVSTAALDPEAVGGAIGRIEHDRAGGMAHLAQRLDEGGHLRPDVTPAAATDVLWALTSFDTFDLVYTGRGRSVDETTRVLVDMAERTLCRSP